MPARSPSSRRYADAIFEIATENESWVQWSGDLQTIADFVGEADVGGLLASNRVPRGDKMRLLSAGLEREISPLAMNLVRILEDKGKLHIARDIQIVFQEKVDDARGIAHAVVTTAVPLSDDERNAIAARLSSVTGKQVNVTPVVDERIIGGLIARIGDQLIDGSTRTKLLALKRQLGASVKS
ncbi:MAG: ATP synthase F1 subunit delta [Dehalococcoidia bacterium]